MSTTVDFGAGVRGEQMYGGDKCPFTANSPGRYIHQLSRGTRISNSAAQFRICDSVSNGTLFRAAANCTGERVFLCACSGAVCYVRRRCLN